MDTEAFVGRKSEQKGVIQLDLVLAGFLQAREKAGVVFILQKKAICLLAEGEAGEVGIGEVAGAGDDADPQAVSGELLPGSGPFGIADLDEPEPG